MELKMMREVVYLGGPADGRLESRPMGEDDEIVVYHPIAARVRTESVYVWDPCRRALDAPHADAFVWRRFQ